MAPKHLGGASIKGKQAAVHEGQFLQFLRSVGYKDELPPSTVAWLESAPVFRFLAAKLSHDNFVSSEDQQEYNELMLARGPDASLYDAVEGFSSDAEDDSCAASTVGPIEKDPFLADLTDEEVSRLLEEEEAYAQQLEHQICGLRAAAGALEARTHKQTETQGPKYFGLKAHAADQLSSVRLDAQQLSDELDSTLQELEVVCSELCSLAQQPQAWLLCAADQSGYRAMDGHINAQHARGVQVLDVCDVALDLHHPTSPTGVSPLALAAASLAGDHMRPLGLQAQAAAGAAAAVVAAPSGSLTPRAGQQPPLTPRQHTQGQSLTAALAEAKAKRRAAHAARNLALDREMGRQQHAFLLSYQRQVEASLLEQGLQAQLAGVQQVRGQSGDFAMLLSQGPSAVQELTGHLMALESTKKVLLHGSLKELIAQVAQLNDCHIVVGDYDRHLAKVSYAMDRKSAMLDSLLRRASLHLLLLLLGNEELRRLAALSAELQEAAGIMEGHVAATEARLQRCAAALEALEKALGLGNLQSGDSYLCALLAAAEGNLVMPEQEEAAATAAGAIAAAAANTDPETPCSMRPASSSLGGGTFTPSYAPTSNITQKLQALFSNLDSSSDQLQRLLDLLPAQLDQHKASACRLHRTAFPPGQPLQTTSSSIAGSIAATAAGSAAGSTWGGSQSAAPSVHSAGSGTSGSQCASQHPQPLLVLPEVADALAAIKTCLLQAASDAHKMINKQNEKAKSLNSDKQRERQVMAKFFTSPEELSADVDMLKAQVQRLQLDQALSL